ncbi:putative serine protease K12H4.7 [Anoplophora glabripennis]|uniref:putative serine protease K12H4.7 n=1 Tax=Anoplophora glabripennis TaxID=217634 RepID=UPI000875546E|nr:putative serine protease K12H4.7 [Anoplophora glabripennis]
MMKLGVTVLILFSVSYALSSESVFRGHLLGYDIPPPKVAVSRVEVATDYFTQRLDHFDPSNTIVWSQRYYVNTEYFNATERETIFLMIAGEGQASVSWMTGGAWIEPAEKYGALLFELEHRFYGVSHPFDDLSTENLRYLSSRQALEDTATFINGMNQEYNLTKDAKWIVFGGSYAGSLAAWLRQKYPHLVQGAMSASGPLFAQLDFPEYLQVVADDLALYSRECVETVKTAFTRLEELVDNPGDENITALFNLCDDIEVVNTESDIANFLEKLTDDVFAYVAQYNKNSGRTTSVDDLCDILVNETYGDEVYRLAEVNKLFYGSTCLDYKYQNTVDYLSDTTITASGNMRQWIYQTCSEYGWYQTSSQEEQVFGTRYPIEFFTNLCVDVYGPEFNTSYINGQIEQINTHFGGYDIDVRNVVFVHGSYDPWYPMGLTETTNSESPVIFIDGTAHCSNMYAATDEDLPQLVEAREEVNRLIGVWLEGEEISGANSPFTTNVLSALLLILSSLVISNL